MTADAALLTFSCSLVSKMKSRFAVRKFKALLGPASVVVLGFGFVIVGSFVAWEVFGATGRVTLTVAVYALMALTGIALVGYGIPFYRNITRYDTVIIDNGVLELHRENRLVVSASFINRDVRIREMTGSRCVVQIGNVNGDIVASDLLRDGAEFTSRVREDLQRAFGGTA